MDMLFTGIGALFVSTVVVLRNIFRLDRLRNEVVFDHVSVTQENADKFSILIHRNDGQSQTRVT